MSRRKSACYRSRLVWLPFALSIAAPSCAWTQASPPSDITDLAVASVRHALAQEHALIAARPNDPIPYVQLAYTLVDAGMGDEAHAAAAEATRVAPDSSFASSVQGWILRHNSIGVDFGKGFDYDGSLRAYKKAIVLDPGNLDLYESFANLLQRNRDGVDYGPGAQLSLAIENYRYIAQHQFPVKPDTEENLGIALFYAARYDEALKALTHPSGSLKRLGLLLAATAASTDSAKAIALSTQIGGDEQGRKDALTLAAEGLWNMRLYPQAADLLTASLPNTADPTISGKIELFRTLKPYQAEDLPASDPRRPIQQLMVAAVTGALSQTVVQQAVSRHSFATDAAWQAALRQDNQVSSIIFTLIKQTGLPRAVLADLILSRMKLTALSSSPVGTPVSVQVLGARPIHFFVLPEDGSWKIAGTETSSSEVGTQALFRLAIHQPAQAAALLDWKNTLVEPVRAGDPLAGSLFAYLWANRRQDNPEAILIAAASLADDPTQLRPILPQILAARQSAGTAETRAHLDLLLTQIFLRLEEAADARIAATRLLQAYPDSPTAIHFAGRADSLNQDWPAWKALLAPHLKAHPNDRDLLLESAYEATAEGNFLSARNAYRLILDGGSALPNDYNAFAWLSLAEGKVDDAALAAAQQASLAAQNRNFSYLHTLACLNAARGNTAEAHQELLDAMKVGHLDEPSADIWFGFGLIDVQYGVDTAAAAAFRMALKLKQPASATEERDPVGIYVLAQARIKALNAN